MIQDLPLSLPKTSAAGQRTMMFSTHDVPAAERGDWWREVICRHYANVDITSRVDDTFHAETRLVHLSQLQLSSVRSSAISIKKLPRDPERIDQDAYFAVLLLSGRYRLEQHGRMVSLLPGDMAIYDATLPHFIDCAGKFSKLIFAMLVCI